MPELTISEIRAQIAAGTLTAVELTRRYMQRIAEIDVDGPSLRAVIEINPDALAIAAELDAGSGPRGPLHGVPILLKDNIETGDRMQTTAGSLALAGAPASADAPLVARLRAAGAIILGKTNLSEWANFRSSRSVSGWSSRGGQTRNPYALDRNPCGSSSGSGVAVAADLAAAAVGTETDGSIICPSSINGIVGIKPTLGLISRTGIVPIAHSQDTAGPMARTVADAAALLGVLAGPDDADPATREAGARGQSDYTQFLDPNGLRGARVGVLRGLAGFNPHVDAIFERAVAALAIAGAEIVDPVELTVARELDEAETTVLLYEFKADLNAYLAQRRPEAEVRSLAEIIAFNDAHSATVMPYFGQELMLKAEEKGPLTDEAYLDALAACRRMARDEGLDVALARGHLDALVAPSNGPAWLIDYIAHDHYTGGNTSPAAVAGYPSITVPAGYVWGLPVGLSFIGAAYSEPTLIRLAYAFEQATRARRAPDFRPTVDLAAGA